MARCDCPTSCTVHRRTAATNGWEVSSRALDTGSCQAASSPNEMGSAEPPLMKIAVYGAERLIATSPGCREGMQPRSPLRHNAIDTTASTDGDIVSTKAQRGLQADRDDHGQVSRPPRAAPASA